MYNYFPYRRFYKCTSVERALFVWSRRRLWGSKEFKKRRAIVEAYRELSKQGP